MGGAASTVARTVPELIEAASAESVEAGSSPPRPPKVDGSRFCGRLASEGAALLVQSPMACGELLARCPVAALVLTACWDRRSRGFGAALLRSKLPPGLLALVADVDALPDALELPLSSLEAAPRPLSLDAQGAETPGTERWKSPTMRRV